MSSLGKLGAGVFLCAVAAFALENRDVADAGTGFPDATMGIPVPGQAKVADIPPAYLAHYKAYGDTCPHLDWALLAGVGSIETNHGRLKSPGVTSGANFAGAAGPMQFLPSTFRGVRARHPEIGPNQYDPGTAIRAAAWKLCDDGVAKGKEYQAIFAYNHAGWYVADVQKRAANYRKAA